MMRIEYDSRKNERNILSRGLSFDRANDLEFESAVFRLMDEVRFGEPRVKVLALLEGVLHALVFTERGDVMRVISFRRASRSERSQYAEEIATRKA
jgi:uncharacterized protein